jgi:hypothetical protein
VQFAVDCVGGDGVCSVPLAHLVAVFRGWQWLPLVLTALWDYYGLTGSGTLPCATLDPADATTAYPPPPVVLEALPEWQQQF